MRPTGDNGDGSAGDAEDRIAEAIASKVLQIIERKLGRPAAEEDAGLIDAGEVARRSGFSRAWVYENAGRLGGVRMGSGSRPRLRFHPCRVAEFLQANMDRPMVEAEPALPIGVPIHVAQIEPRVPERKAR